MALLATLLLPNSASDPTEATPATTYHSYVREVRLTFYATDEAGRALTQLKRDDFAVVDDERVIRAFRSFSRADETRLALIVLVDTSESLLPRFQREVGEVLQLTADSREALAQDVSIVSFGGSAPAVICENDCPTSAVIRQLSFRPATGQTPLYDAVIFAANRARKYQTQGVRPVIILFSDGEDTISRHSERDAIETLVESQAVLFSANLAGSRWRQGTLPLQNMARATGGRYFADGSVVEVMNSILEMLRAGYVVTYEISDRRPGFHGVNVFPTHNLRFQFRCRNGYYYPEGTR